MSDHLGIFGREEGETGELDVHELRAALAAGPTEPDPAAPPPPPLISDEERAQTARRRHRRWLVFAVIVLLIIVAGLIAG